MHEDAYKAIRAICLNFPTMTMPEIIKATEEIVKICNHQIEISTDDGAGVKYETTKPAGRDQHIGPDSASNVLKPEHTV